MWVVAKPGGPRQPEPVQPIAQPGKCARQQSRGTCAGAALPSHARRIRGSRTSMHTDDLCCHATSPTAACNSSAAATSTQHTPQSVQAAQCRDGPRPLHWSCRWRPMRLPAFQSKLTITIYVRLVVPRHLCTRGGPLAHAAGARDHRRRAGFLNAQSTCNAWPSSSFPFISAIAACASFWSLYSTRA